MWIKICGLTDPEAVAAALDARVDALGFVFAPSVRKLTPRQAAALAAPARGRCRLVAVTLHPSQPLIDEVLHVFQPDVLQADREDLTGLRLPAGLERLPVLRAGTAEAETDADAALPEQLLYEGVRSGSGTRADWARAAQLARRTRLVLAGGLTPDNVAQAIGTVRPYGVDVSSGVESAPACKSPARIAQFVAAARAAAQDPS